MIHDGSVKMGTHSGCYALIRKVPFTGWTEWATVRSTHYGNTVLGKYYGLG
jgi:hypothetical protein